MFKKRENKSFDIIVGLSSSINGDIKSEGSVRVDGKITGEIISSGDVIIGDQAKVEANIEAEYCEISGTVVGNVHTDTQLKIFKSGKLKGDITVSSFTIEEGGIFSGNCDINPDKKETKTKSSKNTNKDTTQSDKNKQTQNKEKQIFEKNDNNKKNTDQGKNSDSGNNNNNNNNNNNKKS